MDILDVNKTPSGQPAGPSGCHFTPEEYLIIWRDLTRIPTDENASIRRKVTDYLMSRKLNVTT